MTARICRLPGVKGQVPGRAGESRREGRQDKKGDVRSHIATVGALVPKALRRSAAMCGANPAMCAFRRFPLSVQPCRTSWGFQP